MNLPRMIRTDVDAHYTLLRQLTDDQALRLARATHPVCVTMVMHTSASPARHEANALTIRRAVEDALSQLGATVRDAEAAEAASQVAARLELLRDDEALPVSLSALTVVAVTPERAVVITLPEAHERADACVVVVPPVHALPLLRLREVIQAAHVLELHHDGARLWRWTPEALHPLRYGGLIESFDDFIGDESAERTLHGHHGAGGQHDTPHLHGHDDHEEDRRRDQRKRFFKQLDAALRVQWDHLELPVVLAGPAALTRELAALSSLQHVIDAHLSEISGDMPAAQWHAHVSAFIRQIELARDAARMHELERLRGAPHTEDNLNQIGALAAQGRVSALYIAQGQPLWGRFDPETGALMYLDARDTPERPQDVELRNELAHAVLQRGGEVHVMPPEHLPSRQPTLAVLRG